MSWEQWLAGESVFSPRALSSWQRRTVIGLLVVLLALLNATFLEISWLQYQEHLLLALVGSLFAQTSILAVWGGLTRSPLAVRMPTSLALAALLGLAVAWGSSRISYAGGDLTPAYAGVLAVAIQVSMLQVVRRNWKWQIGMPMEDNVPETLRFGLRQLLLWATATAAFFAVGRWIAPHVDFRLADTILAAGRVIAIALVATLLLLPAVISSVCLVLGHQRERWAAAWLLATGVASLAALIPIMCLVLWQMEHVSSPWQAVGEATEAAVPMYIGMIATLLGALLVMRRLGFCLSRDAGTESGTASDWKDLATFAVEQATARPSSRPHFYFVSAGLLVLIAMLFSTAWEMERQWRERLPSLPVVKEWERVGLRITVANGWVTSARYVDRSKPLETPTLEKLREPKNTLTMRSLNLSHSSITDDQLEAIAGLRTLEDLSLSYTLITSDGMVHLQGLSSLKTLHLNGTSIDDAALASLSALDSLESLYLDNTNVTDAGLWHLRVMPNLRSVSTHGTGVSDKAVTELQKELRK